VYRHAVAECGFDPLAEAKAAFKIASKKRRAREDAAFAEAA
jgi:hypothetical protein